MHKKLPLGLILVLFLTVDAWGIATHNIEDPGQAETPRQGVYYTYYPSGALKSEMGYKDGVLDGRCRVYDENGVLMKQANFRAGKIEGKAFEFYANGQYKIEAQYRNGKPHEAVKVFYENGDLYCYMEYDNGELVKDYFLDQEGRSISK